MKTEQFEVLHGPSNPLTPRISVVVPLTHCHLVLGMLIWRIWYWIS